MVGFYNTNYDFVYQFYSDLLFVNFACYSTKSACRGVLYQHNAAAREPEQCTLKNLFLNSNLLATIMFFQYRGLGNAELSHAFMIDLYI